MEEVLDAVVGFEEVAKPCLVRYVLLIAEKLLIDMTMSRILYFTPLVAICPTIMTTVRSHPTGMSIDR